MLNAKRSAGQVKQESRESNREIALKRLAKPGVYGLRWGTKQVWLLVLSEIEEAKHNALWNLLSGKIDRIQYGAEQYRRHRWEMSSVMEKLFERYQLEGLVMPYTMEEFQRQYVKEHLDVLEPEERLEGLKPEERLEGLKSVSSLPRGLC